MGDIMKNIWKSLIVVSAVATLPSTAGAQSHYEYYVTGHNHYGATVYFSCNGGTPREIHNGRNRTINIHGGHNVEVTCIATHDGYVVWSGSMHMTHEHRRSRFDITRSSDGGHD